MISVTEQLMCAVVPTCLLFVAANCEIFLSV